MIASASLGVNVTNLVIINPSVAVCIGAFHTYASRWNFSSGCALVKVFGFVASLLASCKGKKEKKRKKYILPKPEGVPFARRLTRRALARRGSTMPYAKSQALHSAHQCTVSFGEEHSSVQQHEVLLICFIIRGYCSQETEIQNFPPHFLSVKTEQESGVSSCWGPLTFKIKLFTLKRCLPTSRPLATLDYSSTSHRCSSEAWSLTPLQIKRKRKVLSPT